MQCRGHTKHQVSCWTLQWRFGRTQSEVLVGDLAWSSLNLSHDSRRMAYRSNGTRYSSSGGVFFSHNVMFGRSAESCFASRNTYLQYVGGSCMALFTRTRRQLIALFSQYHSRPPKVDVVCLLSPACPFMFYRVYVFVAPTAVQKCSIYIFFRGMPNQT